MTQMRSRQHGDIRMFETPPEDVRLIERLLRRDQTALAELYDRYSSQVYGLTVYILRDTALAEEATQDTFMKLWNSAANWDMTRARLGTWLLTLARYSAIDRLRREKRQTPGVALDIETMVVLIDQAGIHDADAALVQSLIAQLPPDQIQTLELAFFQGMSHSEIATHLDEPLGTVKSRIRSGLQTLRGLWLRAVQEQNR